MVTCIERYDNVTYIDDSNEQILTSYRWGKLVACNEQNSRYETLPKTECVNELKREKFRCKNEMRYCSVVVLIAHSAAASLVIS